MRLKGSTKIELTNVRTGKKETYTHENFVTEFASEYFKEAGALNTNPLGSLQNERPIDDLFGGIMLFDKKIDAQTDDVGNHPHPLYCPAGTKMVANGSVDFISNSSATELGQYNAQASGTPNERQRVYVYDWATNEGNGKINCVCLTSKAGGYIGVGNSTSGVADRTSLEKHLFDYKGTPDTQRTFPTGGARVAGLDLGQSQVAILPKTAAECFQEGSVTVDWYDVPVSKLNPFISKKAFNIAQVSPKRSQTHSITLRATATNARVMGGTGYILLIGSSSASIQNGSTIFVSQIAKDGTVVNRQYTVSGFTNAAIALNNDNFIGGKLIGTDLYIIYSYAGWTRAVRIKADGSSTNIIDSGNISEYVCAFNEGKLYVSHGRYYDIVDEEVYVTNTGITASYSDSMNVWQCYDCNLMFRPPLTQTGATQMTPLAVVRPPCNWLSTINNLPQEIEKTGDKTMQVTYTLTLQA